MPKTAAVAAMGPSSLLLPARLRAALTANDRLKLCLSVLQAAAAHARQPEATMLDLAQETALAGADGPWLRELPAAASSVDGVLQLPGLRRLAQRMATDLVVMARPVLDAAAAHDPLRARSAFWLDWLGHLGGHDPAVADPGAERLDEAQLHRLTDGQRSHGGRHGSEPPEDSLHLLVMDLHKQVNALSAGLATEDIDGAHVWQIRAGDRAHVAAFMRGLNRSAPLKFDHPGLDTAATRDGKRLLIQNDIGTNDAHVLVVQVEAKLITLNYSDLHRVRFDFFQTLLTPLGAVWAATQSKVDAKLNDGQAYTFGSARFDCADAAAVDAALEGLASRIVFLIDWNRARKRLLPFVGKAAAIEVLREAVRLEAGHMAWLKCGGEGLIFGAMQAVGGGALRIGDRLDAVLGTADAQAFLVEVLCLASKALLAGQPVALVADETHMLLARRLRQRSSEFELIEEHAAYCHALAQAVSDGLAHDATAPADQGHHQAQTLADKAKRWERQADHLVMQAREQARRQPRWQPFARLLAVSDDVADALEEAAFLISLIAEHHRHGWDAAVHQGLSRLAQTVLAAMQEHIKALAIARRMAASGLGGEGAAADSDAFLAATWKVLQSERDCDELLRSSRRAILAAVHDAPSLMLANDLALTLELASDHLLAASYALREVAFDQASVRA